MSRNPPTATDRLANLGHELKMGFLGAILVATIAAVMVAVMIVSITVVHAVGSGPAVVFAHFGVTNPVANAFAFVFWAVVMFGGIAAGCAAMFKLT